MIAQYAVTFEFDTLPPLTHRGTVVAAAPGTCVRRAVEAAQKPLRPVNWSSLVVVLLERAGEPDALDGAVA